MGQGTHSVTGAWRPSICILEIILSPTGIADMMNIALLLLNDYGNVLYFRAEFTRSAARKTRFRISERSKLAWAVLGSQKKYSS